MRCSKDSSSSGPIDVTASHHSGTGLLWRRADAGPPRIARQLNAWVADEFDGATRALVA